MSDSGVDLDQYLAQLAATSSVDDNAPRILGEERGYTPPGADSGVIWQEGDAAAMVNRMRPSEITKIQQVLAQSGLISGSVQFGLPDSRTVSAYEQVLTMSNRSGLSPLVILGRLASTNRDLMLEEMNRASASGPTRAPFTARVSNPDELRRFFHDAVVELTGSSQNIDIDAMVSAYQTAEKNSQAQAYNAAPTGGTVTDAPSPEEFARQQVEQQAGDEMQANGVVERAGQLFNMLGSFGGQ